MLWQKILEKWGVTEKSQSFAAYYVLFKVLSVYDTAPPTTANVFREGLSRLSALGFSDDHFFIRELRQRWASLAAADIREARGERA